MPAKTKGREMTKDECAMAFVSGKSGKCHNAETNGTVYKLHGTVIAWKETVTDPRTNKPQERILGDFQGFYTITTAAHLNAILKACNGGFKVSAAKARAGQGSSGFTVYTGK